MVGWVLFLFGLAAVSVMGAVWPQATWRVLDSWRWRDPELHEPSEAAYSVQRVAYVVMAVCCVGLGISLLKQSAESRREDCEAILLELGAAVPTGATGIDAEDIDARWDFYDAASALGVSVESQGDGDELSYRVVRDGEVLGTIGEYGVDESRCDQLG